jgi:hypothetical protein
MLLISSRHPSNPPTSPPSAGFLGKQRGKSAMTNIYEISNRESGQVLGQYQGDDENEAKNGLAQDAGYPTYDKMCEETGGYDELSVIEICDEDLL